jgi:hypothetical protein
MMFSRSLVKVHESVALTAIFLHGVPKMNCLKLLVAATALGMAGQAYAAQDDAARTVFQGRVNVVDRVTGHTHSMLRCGFENPSRAERDQIERNLREFRASDRAPLIQGAVVPAKNIKVHFHVLTTNSGVGNVDEAKLDSAITVMNAAYAGTGFTFTKVGSTRTKNTTWYSACDRSTVERQIRKALAVDPARTFNVYLCNLGGGLLGRATFPTYFAENSFMHGVVIHNGTVPGGSFNGYNGGDTLVHEAGHYLGLYHTFQGGCVDGANGGDYVVDTPAEASATYDCNVNKDSCASEGKDSVTNYMNYGSDACMTNFTTDQRIRAWDQTSLYKPSLGQ